MAQEIDIIIKFKLFLLLFGKYSNNINEKLHRHRMELKITIILLY